MRMEDLQYPPKLWRTGATQKWHPAIAPTGLDIWTSSKTFYISFAEIPWGINGIGVFISPWLPLGCPRDDPTAQGSLGLAPCWEGSGEEQYRCRASALPGHWPWRVTGCDGSQWDQEVGQGVGTRRLVPPHLLFHLPAPFPGLSGQVGQGVWERCTLRQSVADGQTQGLSSRGVGNENQIGNELPGAEPFGAAEGCRC